jgi:hypothetical protein
MFYSCMTDRPASWRMPTQKQIERLPSPVDKQVAKAPAAGPADTMPAQYWEAVLNDPLADGRLSPAGPSTQTLRLSEIRQHILRVSCNRCGRTVEIQKADAVRLAGAHAVWKEVGQRLLDNTCEQRTGRHEEDGCWPVFE